MNILHRTPKDKLNLPPFNVGGNGRGYRYRDKPIKWSKSKSPRIYGIGAHTPLILCGATDNDGIYRRRYRVKFAGQSITKFDRRTFYIRWLEERSSGISRGYYR